MDRRVFLAGAAASLAAPSVARAQGARVLRFIPQSDLVILDPIWTTAYVTRNHGYMVYDTLYGHDSSYSPSPQMVAGHVVSNSFLQWDLTLRDGLLWHDGERVLARDCVASIRRWSRRDSFGQALMAVTDELTAPDDRTIRFRLKRPFPLLPDALAKSPSPMPAMMPERLAKTDPFTQVAEVVGSGPYRFVTKERVSGAKAVYERFAGYVPRDEGTPDWTAGRKVANFDRIEWTTIADPATAAAALQNGEHDWWEYATADLLPLLRKDRRLRVSLQNPSGHIGMLRFNCLQPPFNNPEIRRAIFGAISQPDVMTAVATEDPSMWHTPTGFFCPGTPMASDVGTEVLKGPRDYGRVRRDLAAAGYKGERVVLLAAADLAHIKAMGDVTSDALVRSGLNVDYVAADWGTVNTRRVKKVPVEQGGWSALCTSWAGTDMLNPVLQLALRANGEEAWIGWPTIPELEMLRQAWLDAADLAAQQAVAKRMQEVSFQQAPYIPLGQYEQGTAYTAKMSGMLSGFALFWNLRKSN